MPANLEKEEEYQYLTASPEDNEDILRLLQTVPMGSSLPIRFDRAPNYFVFEDRLKTLNARHLIARNNKNEIVGFLHCDILNLLSLNNQYEPFLCLGNLRIASRYQGLKIAQNLICKMAEQSIEGNYGGSFCFVNEGNKAMLQVVKTIFAKYKLGLSDHNLGCLQTYSILFYGGEKKITDFGFVYVKGTLSDLDELVELYMNEHGRSFLSHQVDRDLFLDLFNGNLNLSVENIRILRDKKSGKILAFTLIWDQGGFKKLFIDRYTVNLNFFRLFLNLSSSLGKCKKAPSVGQPLRFFETTYMTFKDKDPKICNSFLRHIHNEFIKGDFHFFNMGISNGILAEEFLKDFMYQSVNTHILYFHLIKRTDLTHKIGTLPIYADTWFI